MSWDPNSCPEETTHTQAVLKGDAAVPPAAPPAAAPPAAVPTPARKRATKRQGQRLRRPVERVYGPKC